MKKQNMKYLVCMLFSMLLILAGTSLFAQQMKAGDSQGVIPKVGFGKKKVVEIPDKPMFYYEAGQRVELEQDFGFVAVSFAKENFSKADRHKYYKKLTLVVSELKEETLLKENIYVIRLMPGATEKKWNIFTQYMYRDSEIKYVGRVFKKIGEDKIKVLWVTTGDLKIEFKDQVDIEKCNALSVEFPLTFKTIDTESNSAYYKKRDITIDDVDLANQMFETEKFVSVEPVFIKIKGKTPSEEDLGRLNRELMDSAPENVKLKMERQKAEHMKKMQREMKEKMEKSKQKQ